MASYGDYRSAREGANVDGIWSYVGKVAYSIEDPVLREVAVKEWWRLADLGEVATAVVWCDGEGDAKRRDAIGWIDSLQWEMRLGDIILASDQTFDKKPFAFKWAGSIVQEVIPLFKDWAIAHDPANVRITDEVFAAMRSGDSERIREASQNCWDYSRQNFSQSYSASSVVSAVSCFGQAASTGSLAISVAFAEKESGDFILTRETAKRWSLRWTEHVLEALREEMLK